MKSLKAGLHLIKKNGKEELYKSVSYVGGKIKVTYTKVIRRGPKYSTNIVRDISTKAAEKQFKIKLPKKRKKRNSRQKRDSFNFFGF